MKRKIFLSLFILLSQILFSGDFQSVYRIQVYSSNNQESVNTFINSLSQKGLSPKIIQKDGRLKVCLGEFKNYPDALYEKNEYRKSQFTDAFIIEDSIPITEANSGIDKTTGKSQEIFQNQSIDPSTLPDDFSLSGNFANSISSKQNPIIDASILSANNEALSKEDLLKKSFAYSKIENASDAVSSLNSFISRFPDSEKIPDCKLSLGYWKMREGKTSEAISCFSDVIEKYPRSACAGDAALRVGYMKYSGNKKDEALVHWEQIANGTIQSSPGIALEAMYRCANIYHSNKDNIKALQAFNEIAGIMKKSGKADPAVDVQIAGLYLELYHCGKAKIDDAIGVCDKVISNPTRDERSLAAAKQIKCESLYIKNDFAGSQALANDIIKNHASIKEISIIAYFYSGLVDMKNNNLPGAYAKLTTITEIYSDKDNLPGHNLQLESYLLLAQISLKNSNYNEAKQHLKNINVKYPNSKYKEEVIKIVNNNFTEKDKLEISGQ